MRRSAWYAAICALLCASLTARAAVIVNEFQYDDAGTDHAEFVELYNSGPGAVDISGWTLIGRDPTTVNSSATVPAATMLAAGGYYVFGNAAVAGANQTIAANFLENDNESVEIRDGSGALIDAAIYESNKGISGNLTGSGLPAETAGGVYANHQFAQPGGDGTGSLSGSVGRYLDGRDTNVNGSDFGMRLATPGASNQSAGVITKYLAPDVSGDATGSTLPGYAFSFVGARVIEPGVVDANNPNAIPNPPGGTKAIIGWDPSGGGNGINHGPAMDGTMSYAIYAYFDTNDIPVNSNSAGTMFRGSEVTQFGLGSSDSFTNLSDVSGQIGVGGVVSANGATGVLWHYEKVGVPVGGGAVSETLYLIDAGPGGNSNSTFGTFAWTILATIDLSSTPSDWYQLAISIKPDGTGVARFDDQVFLFQTAADQVGSFYAGYRENTQDGADGTPAYNRPATWASIPEPGTLALMAIGLISLVARRRR